MDESPKASPFRLPTCVLGATVPLGGVFLLALAFLLASSPANNSDVWLHLATGRALVNADYQFGVEPFTYANVDSYWVNPSWLYDLLLYFLSWALGYPALVIIKAGLIVVLAGIIMVSGRTGKGYWSSVTAGALCLVAIGPWLALKPVSISFLFLGLTAWFLERRICCPGMKQAPTFLSCLPLLILFALWANLDAWFFLGPLLMALCFLGQMLDSTKLTAKENPRSLASWSLWAWLLPVSLAACMLNPHHFWIYQVPLEMAFSDVRTTLSHDSFLRLHLLAPFNDAYFSVRALRHAPGIAFWLLVSLSLAFFFLNRSCWPWRWRLTWASFLCLSLFQTQWVPFFTIVAAPMLARAVGHFASQGLLDTSPRRFGVVRGLAFFGMLLLPVAAWPGWLQLDSPGPREWRVNLDPGLERAAKQVASLRAESKISAGGRGFFFAPEAANCFAWLFPQDKCLVNSHFHVTPELAADFLLVREGLTGHKPLGSQGRDWRRVLHEHKVNHLVIHSNDFRSTLIVTNTLLAAYAECPLLFLRGRTAVFGWRDPEVRPEPKPGTVNDCFTPLEINLRRLGFAPGPRDASMAGRPPAETPPLGSRPFFWWEAFLRPRVEFSLDVDEAAVLINSFDSAQDATLQSSQARGTTTFLAGLFAQVGSAGSSPWSCVGCVGLAMPWQEAFVRSQDDGPLENLYLAVRAARRAVQKQPGNPQAFLVLGEAYYRIMKHSRERVWHREFPLLGKIRTAQALSALQQAALLDPASLAASARLAQLYRDMDYKDLALDHLRKVLDLARKSGAEDNRALEKGVAALTNEVNAALNRYEGIAQNLRVEDRAFLGGRHGLAGKALQTLLTSELAAFGKRGLEMELNLLLNTGQPDAVIDWLTPDLAPLLGPENYHWIKAQAEAALGNYRASDQDLQAMLVTELPGSTLKSPADLALLVLGNTLLTQAAGGPFQVLPFPTLSGYPLREHLPQRMLAALRLMKNEAKIVVTRGMLALEAGETTEAQRHFRAALAFWNSPAGEGFPDPSSRMCRIICRFFLEEAAGTGRR